MQQLEARILVRGASTVGWTSVMNGPRSEMTFPRVIERELVRRRIPTSVQAVTVPGMPTSAVLRCWEDDIIGYSPDVVVYMVGHYETIHALWPRRLERHANGFRGLQRPGRLWYRKRVLRPTWRALVRLQKIVDARIDVPRGRRRVRQAATDMRRTITLVRQIQSPLVVLMEIPDPGSAAVYLFPGIARRIDDYNTRLRAMVAEIGSPEVLLFPTNAVLESAYPGARDEAMPDGFHFAGAAHDLVGRELAAMVAGWLAAQPHLQPLDPATD